MAESTTAVAPPMADAAAVVAADTPAAPTAGLHSSTIYTVVSVYCALTVDCKPKTMKLLTQYEVVYV